MATKINPKTLRGPWAAGFALDVHTTTSTFRGHNEYGHPVFDTERSPIGELVYRLKYRGDKDALREIVDTVTGFSLGDMEVEGRHPGPGPTLEYRQAESAGHGCSAMN
jgi:hypothetical protein